MRGPHRARALRDRSIACSCLARVIAFSTLRICTSTSAGLIRANRPSERTKVMASVEPFAELHRSEEHTSELQYLMRISYAVFCLKKKTNTQHSIPTETSK